MSTDELRPIRDRLNCLPDVERACVEAMIYQILDLPNCGPLSAIEIVQVTLTFALREKRAAQPARPALCLSPARKRQNRKQA